MISHERARPIKSSNNEVDMQPYERLIAGAIKTILRRFPQLDHAQILDLQQEARLALIKALPRMDNNVSYIVQNNYLSIRILGAMSDYLRAQRHTSRYTRNKLRDAKLAKDKIKARGEAATDEAIARELGIKHVETIQHRIDRGHSRVVSLDEINPTTDEPYSNDIADPDATSVLDKMIIGTDRKLVLKALEKLNERNARLASIIKALYIEGKTAEKFAKELGVTPTRVGQLKKDGLELMKEYLEGLSA